MSDLSEEEQSLIAANIAWLDSAGPDDWHRAALDFNWDDHLHVLDWIVRQPDCDIATALTIFWKSEPECWIDREESIAESPDGYSSLIRNMCSYIAHRIKSKAYTRSKIAYRPDIWTTTDFDNLVKRERSLAKPSFRTHPDLIRRCRGRKISNDQDFYRRYPADFHGTVIVDLPGYNSRSFMLMARVKFIAFKTTVRRFAFSLRT